MGRYSGGDASLDVAHLLKAYGDTPSNRVLAQTTKKLERTGMSILAYTQPSHVKDFAGSDKGVSGLVARVFMVFPDSKPKNFNEVGGVPNDVALAIMFQDQQGEFSAITAADVTSVCILTKLVSCLFCHACPRTCDPSLPTSQAADTCPSNMCTFVVAAIPTQGPQSQAYQSHMTSLQGTQKKMREGSSDLRAWVRESLLAKVRFIYCLRCWPPCMHALHRAPSGCMASHNMVNNPTLRAGSGPYPATVPGLCP
jgi:hypothetical protein